jgi:integrase
MSVKLRKRKNADGTTSLRLDIFRNGERKIETLKHLQLSKSSTLLDREQNKKRMQQAEEIAVARASQLEANNYNMVTDAGKKTIVAEWMQCYVDGYLKKDKRNMQGSLNRFIVFLKEDKSSDLKFGDLTALIIEDFIQYLENNSTGEGASSYYSRFKKMVKHAYRKRLMKENVLDFVERKVKGKAKKKDTLSQDEIKILAVTPTESAEVRRAFLFSCFTGLRWIDVKNLQWSSINVNGQMNVIQTKTKENICTNLNESAIKLLGEGGKEDDFVFRLPSANGANKTIKAWVKRAGINKKITWHNARHSAGTNLALHDDVSLQSIADFLGHTSPKHSMRYITLAKEMKQRTADKLNIEL